MPPHKILLALLSLSSVSAQSPVIDSTESTTPFWLSEGQRWQSANDRTTPNLLSQAEVVVIGGGISGMSTAYWLQQNGVEDVVVLESRGVASAGSGRNGGHVHPGYYDPNIIDIIRYGEAELIRFKQFEADHILLAQDFANQYGNDFDLLVPGCLDVKVNQQQADNALEHVRDLNSRNLTFGGVEFWSPDQVNQALNTPGQYFGAIYSRLCGQVYPSKWVWKIADAVESLGGNIQTHTHVLTVVDNGGSDFTKRIITARGEIEAKVVVYATNAYTWQLLPHHRFVLPVAPTRGQVIATPDVREISGVNFPYPMVGHGGYLLQRPSDGRIIYGGGGGGGPSGRGIFSDITKEPEPSRFLIDNIKNVWSTIPADIKSDYDWTGVMGITNDGRPMIGPLPSLNAEKPVPVDGYKLGAEYVVIGMSGEGIARGFNAGKLLAELIVGEQDYETFHATMKADRFITRDLGQEIYTMEPPLHGHMKYEAGMGYH